MKKDLSTNGLFIGSGTAFAIITGCFITVIFVYSEDWIIKGAAIVFSLLFFLLGITLILVLRKKLLAFSESLNVCIDDIVNGKNEVDFDLESETLTGKFNYKLKRLYEIMERNSNQTKIEKKAIQEMISDISHQVKTPVANLKMYNSTLLERPLSPQKQREFLSIMETQINKLDFLMQSMVKMSRLETGVIALAIQSAPLYDTVGLALGSIVLPAEKRVLKSP